MTGKWRGNDKVETGNRKTFPKKQLGTRESFGDRRFRGFIWEEGRRKEKGRAGGGIEEYRLAI